MTHGAYLKIIQMSREFRICYDPKKVNNFGLSFTKIFQSVNN